MKIYFIECYGDSREYPAEVFKGYPFFSSKEKAIDYILTEYFEDEEYEDFSVCDIKRNLENTDEFSDYRILEREVL